ncbi:MAG: xanthine dehydrogenase family protein molybdopterin-binding subunit [Alphaproteobacteria bacterium]|nr:xanthine dehydrogenase family protein molybdopterin-binding subunit [Alphaproteobacteria bacterium]MCZ6592389.1 xanthine dehydrogenase family protein molybdopterin-binding subunit [Alphaproteobacteria bacterium]
MDAPVFGTGPYAVSQPVTRTEDPRLLRGGGVYTDDRNLPGQAYAVFVRSVVAHGDIKAINIDAAKAAPGVLAVYTHTDIDAAGFGNLPNNLPLKSRDGSDLIVPPRPALAKGRVRNVGEPVVGVIAETLDQARDAAELVELEIDPLPANTDVDAAVADGALQLHEDAPGNVCIDFQMGDADATAAGFEAAAHVTRLRLVNNQVFVSAMEPRAFIGDYDTERDRYVVYTGCQGVFGLRNGLANAILKVAPEKVRVIAGDIGGSFGMKAMPYNEYPVVLLAAKQLGRPVKWTADRSESMLSDHMGRGSVYDAELALDADGKFLAARVNGIANMGSYLTGTGPLAQTVNVCKNLPCMYQTPAVDVNMRCVFTNTVYVGAYRGAGRPEGNYIMERLVDTAAREMGIDRVEIRRKNLVSPDAMPFTAASGQVYDSGDFEPIFDKALAAADWDGFGKRRAASEAAGMKRGLGICAYLEVTAPAGKEMGGLRFTDDRVTIVSGTLDYGQGHRSTFAQILSARLGIPFDKIDLLQGDSDELIVGGGTGGSRSVIAEAGALYETAAEVIEKGRAVAGHVLEAAVEDVEFADGEFRIAGTDRSIGIFELATRARELGGVDGLPETIDTELVHDTAPSAFPNGVHICEVEIDPETGTTRVDRYAVVDDFGTIVNPLLAEGQVHGGIVQGIGQALMEHIVYDDDGQLLTGSYMDYQLPRAIEVPDIVFDDHPVPATTNVLGAKGAGEAGCSGALPAVMNAMVDALAEYGVTNIDMPATPHRVWQAIHGNAS